MAIQFNANEILEMAVRMESNGASFYRRAAGLVGDAATGELLLSLAAMEDEHRRVFALMQNQLDAQQRTGVAFDPEEEVLQYARAFVDGVVFDAPAEGELAGQSADGLLRIAIGLEKDSIAFYAGLREMVPPRLGRDKVDRIIREELGHVTLLAGRRRLLTVPPQV